MRSKRKPWPIPAKVRAEWELRQLIRAIESYGYTVIRARFEDYPTTPPQVVRDEGGSA